MSSPLPYLIRMLLFLVIVAAIGWLLHDDLIRVFLNTPTLDSVILGVLVLGIFFGPAQAASRSLMARLVPRGMEAEMFGLYALTGKATAFAGPLLLGWATVAYGSQRAGMATTLAFIALGFVLLLFVKAPKRA